MIQCVPDTSGRSLGSHAQILYLPCHHGKALSGFPGSRRLNRSVQCQKVRLERDPLYGARLFLYHIKFLLKVLEHLLDLAGERRHGIRRIHDIRKFFRTHIRMLDRLLDQRHHLIDQSRHILHLRADVGTPVHGGHRLIVENIVVPGEFLHTAYDGIRSLPVLIRQLTHNRNAVHNRVTRSLYLSHRRHDPAQIIPDRCHQRSVGFI